MPVHDFNESLEESRRHSDAPWWLTVYREAFPDLESMACVRDDGWAQRAGIDRVLTLSCGKTLTVDEKVRTEDWPDILLEYWSDRDRKIRGWVAKPLACDFIAYAFVPSQRCFLLPYQSLRRAWRQNRERWVKNYKRIEALNGGYVTVSVGVPTGVLLHSLSNAMQIKWGNETAACAVGHDDGARTGFGR